MALTSIPFLLFLLAVLILYYLVPRRFQWVLLLVASYTFYLLNGIPQVFFLLGATLVTWGSGLLMQSRRDRYKAYLSEHPELEKAEKQKLKKRTEAEIHRIQALTVLAHLLVLALVKYSGFLVENLNALLRVFGARSEIPGFHILVPLGISFYTFMAMGYVIDVGRGKYAAERNPGKLALFLSFFPAIIQGPISRYGEIGEQLTSGHSLDTKNLAHGAQLILFGFFKKLVIADRVAPVAVSLFNPQYFDSLSGTSLFVGMLTYALQIYCDFSGGIDITLGVAEMMGITLPKNFERPYFSTSVAEYWRRWHITLGAWMREYVFYPIMLSRPVSRLSKRVKQRYGQKEAKYVPSVITPFCVFLLIGVWHGASWQYVAFGLYNAIIVSGSVLLEPAFQALARRCHLNTETLAWKIVRIIRTFLMLGISKILVKAADLTMAFKTIGKIFTNVNFGFLTEISQLGIGLSLRSGIVLAVATAGLFLVSLLQERGMKIRETIDRRNIVIRWGIWLALIVFILVFGVYGAGYDAASFIYQAY